MELTAHAHAGADRAHFRFDNVPVVTGFVGGFVLME